MKIDPVYNFTSYEDTGDLIHILNGKQSAFYAQNGCAPKDIFPSSDRKTGEPVWVYIFSRKETRETGVYDSWCKRKQDEIDRGE